MSVLIRGMEMPKSCPCKLVGVGYDLYCSFTSGIPSRMREYRECCEKKTKPDWCPLIEVSADKIVMTRSEFEFYSRCMIIALELRDLLAGIRLFEEKLNPNGIKGNAPTISEAEEVENDS